MERLIICGGGHVSLSLAQVGALLEFDLVVIDDRAEFANAERFPMASQVLAMPFLEALQALGSRENDYYVIVTRGHSFDRDCLAKVLEGKYAYVGMIGSKTKIAAVMDSLHRSGFSQERLDGVHTPIGLKLGGQTPAEVAVSIAAELVQVRSGFGPSEAPPPDGAGDVLCTIVRKTGSAPRGVGAWMLVRADGSIQGTIGGGAVEFQAINDAREHLAQDGPVSRRTYDLTPRAADLGMVCGGVIEVEFMVRRIS